MADPARSTFRLRLFLAVLLCVVAGITAAALRESMNWIDRPFNGFFLAENLIVMESGLADWSGATTRVPIGARLTAINGRPVTSVEQALSAARKAGADGVLQYTFRQGRQTISRVVPVMVFRLRDYFPVFANPFFVGLTFLMMGFIVGFLRTDQHDARAFLLVSLSYGLALILRLDDFAGFHFRLIQSLTTILAPAALVYLGASFPVAQPWVSSLRVRIGWLAVIGVGLLLEIGLFNAAPEEWYAVHTLSQWLLILALGVAASGFAYTYLNATEGVVREKLRVVVLGALVAFLLPLLMSIVGEAVGTPFPDQAFAALTWVFPASFAYAIIKRSAFDIDVFLRRGAVYAILSVAVVLAYAGVVTMVIRASRDATAIDSPWFTLFFSLGLLLIFRPLIEFLQAWIDRLFFRSRFDYGILVQSLSQALTRALNPEEIGVQLRHVVSRTFAPVSLGLHLRDEAEVLQPLDRRQAPLLLSEPILNSLLAGRVLDEADLALVSGRGRERLALLVPVRFEGRLEGVIAIGPKRSGAGYGPRDVELLRTFANQIATALRHAASYVRLNEVLQSLESRVQQRTRDLQNTQLELATTNERLRELDRLKTRFFADASHELRTPLTLVLGPLDELLRLSQDLDPGTSRLIEMAHGNAARLLVLTDTLLDLSRLDAGRVEPRLRNELLGVVVEQAAEPFRWLAEQRGIRFDIDLCNEPVVVRLDASMIGKVVGNLLSNAFKFTHSGSVKVQLTRGTTETSLEVIDTGPGIPPDEIPYLFDRYRQASTAERSKLSGSGLGLSLVREFVTLHEGTVSVESTPAGSRFTVTLPLAQADADSDSVELPTISIAALAAASRSEPEVPLPTRTELLPVLPEMQIQPSILVVDDNPNLLEFLRQLFGESYRVRTASNAVEALRSALDNPPDAILSDVMMPGPDGIAFCKIVKGDPGLARIPLVLLTARAGPEAKVAALEAGADDYVTKPFHPEELKARVAGLLRARAAERDLQRSHRELSAAYQRLTDTQTQLVQAEKLAALGTLVAGMAHEINNPISFIMGSIDLIADNLRDLRRRLDALDDAHAAPFEYAERFDVMQDNVAICRDGANRAARIVADLRAFGRPSAGPYRLANLHEVLDRTLRLIHGEYKDRITVTREYGELPYVPCDEGQLGQVFLNLLINALHAIEGPGEIHIRTRSDGARVVIEIEDSGVGMDATMLGRIFDPFFTTRDPGRGTGLGLSVSRSIIAAHGGTIEVDSRVGEGTRFCISLPAEEDANSAA